jgi:DNA-binding IclR family transcriptional regulator
MTGVTVPEALRQQAIWCQAFDSRFTAELCDVMADDSSVGAAALDHNGYPIAAIGVTFRAGIPDDAVDALGATVVATAAALGARALGRA